MAPRIKEDELEREGRKKCKFSQCRYQWGRPPSHCSPNVCLHEHLLKQHLLSVKDNDVFIWWLLFDIRLSEHKSCCLSSKSAPSQPTLCIISVYFLLLLSVQTFHPPALHQTHHFMVPRFCVILFCVYNSQHISCISQVCIWTRPRTKCVAKGNQSHCVLRLL